jgi:hypothetical protein
MMAVLPNEIRLVNHNKIVFTAIACVSLDGNFLYNPYRDAYQYRVQIPNVEISMIVVEVTDRQLREFMANKQPIPMPYAR